MYIVHCTYICMYIYMFGKVFLDITQKYKLFYKDRHHQDLTQKLCKIFISHQK